MTFSNDKPIYIQMADRLCDEILSGVYQDERSSTINVAWATS